ncbi:hypothetical protein PVAP13_2NG022800 [Panicum virgatum]|uniref:Uncharacterized protein n=1 Tax=Panicum virgatum TaxID=38727 RepID=A0A8T0VC02_PANVG|nr:hypothetical protein PVAP13_2NG022800 [Panicum virgatum]
MMKRTQQEFHNWFFMLVSIIATWHIWKQRNNLIFEGRRPTVREWTSNFIEEARLQAHRIKDSKRQDFLNWVNNVQHRALCLAARKTDAIEFYLPGLKCPFDLLPSLRRRPQELHSHRLPYIIYRVIFLAHFMLRFGHQISFNRWLDSSPNANTMVLVLAQFHGWVK